MVKSKKMSKSSIAVIILSLLLVLSMIMGITGAWFTDKVEFTDAESESLGFGRVNIEGTGETTIGYTIYEKTGDPKGNDYSQLIDGDKITITDSLSVANNSNVEILYFVIQTLDVEVTPPQGLVLNSFTKEDVLSWVKKGEKTLGEFLDRQDYGALLISGSLASGGEIPVDDLFNGDYVVDSEGHANDKVGTFKITATANVYAVQKGNLFVGGEEDSSLADIEKTMNNIKAAFKAAGLAEEVMEDWGTDMLTSFGFPYAMPNSNM